MSYAMTDEAFETIKARAIAGEEISCDEVKLFTPEQAEAFADLCRTRAGLWWRLEDREGSRKLYGAKPPL